MLTPFTTCDCKSVYYSTATLQQDKMYITNSMRTEQYNGNTADAVCVQNTINSTTVQHTGQCGQAGF